MQGDDGLVLEMRERRTSTGFRTWRLPSKFAVSGEYWALFNPLADKVLTHAGDK